MARASAARSAALALLGDVRRRDARARDVLRSSKRLQDLGARDRAFVVRLVMGVVGSVGLLDECVDVHLKRPSRLEPKVRDALRLGAYELLFLHTPKSAAVSQGVELVRFASPRAAGLANAVLRRVAEVDVPAREEAFGRVRCGDGMSTRDLAMVSGYPEWLVSRVERTRGSDFVRGLCLSATEAAPLYVAARGAAHRADDETEGLLRSAGLDPAPGGVEGSYVLRNPAGLASSGLVERCDVVVADLSAQRVARSVASHAASSVLEIGQGRGTKSILVSDAARRAGKELRIVGVDSQPFKVGVAERRMEVAGLSGTVSCHVYDACELDGKDVPSVLEGPFQTVFVDAPCSGTGTLRRHPEIAWSLDEQSVDSLVALQGRIVAAASRRVAPGGFLCYATCSVLRRENEDVVDAFLISAAGEEFELVEEPFLSAPCLGGADGHFCAIMSRG